jgi:hypothetical protein
MVKVQFRGLLVLEMAVGTELRKNQGLTLTPLTLALLEEAGLD